MTQSATGAGPSVSLITLGCKLNLADSEQLARVFTAAGCSVIDRPVSADIFVINTCSVTHVADRKSRRMVRLARRLSPESTIVLTGCYAETGGPDLATITGADMVLDNAGKNRLVEHVVGSRTGHFRPAGKLPVVERTGNALRTRAFLKIQEGCNDVCAFCIVPRTRGREQSTAIEEIVARVQQCEQEGVQEVVLTGTQLGAYGRDGNNGLAPKDVIRAVLAETSVPRIRFSSLQPQDITPEVVGLWEDPRLCRHFHLALQSGSETVLRRMRRRYSVQEYRSALALIRGFVPDVAITTDVIVGFPGESDDEFNESYAFCEEAGFSTLHVFPYSRRSGTTADKMPDHVTPDTRRSRMERMLALKLRLENDFRRRYIDRRLAVLWETEKPAGGVPVWEGLTDNYLRVFTETALPLHNRLTGFRITGLAEDGLTGVVEGC